MNHDVFVSYSTKDKAVADAVVAALENQGIRCWVAPRDIKPGADWGESITEAINACKIVLLIFSGNSNQSKRVRDEIFYAIAEEKTLIPFRIENLDPTGAMRLHLSSLHWLDAYQPSWQAHLERLVSSVADSLGRAAPAPVVETEPPAPAAREPQKARKKTPWLWIGLAFVLLAVLSAAGVVWLNNRGGLTGLQPEPLSQQTEVRDTPAVTQTGTKLPSHTHTASPTATEMQTITPKPTLPIVASMVSPQDGMMLVYVPAGEFGMGAAADEGYQVCEQVSNSCEMGMYSNEEPVHTVYLDAYWIDQAEVSNAMYSLCVEAGGCAEPKHTLYYTDPVYRDHPVVHVDWNSAKVYCEWAGRRLPTEAEWEKAARGTDGRMFPWGDDLKQVQANFFNRHATKTVAVDRYQQGASPYGALNMAGNVWEWAADWYDDNYYSSSPSSNPSGPTSGTRRVIRGGSFYETLHMLRASVRGSWLPEGTSDTIGFRCALSP